MKHLRQYIRQILLKEAEDCLQVIDYTRGYKQISGIKRLPIAKAPDGTVVTSLEEIEERGLTIQGKGYHSTKVMHQLFEDEIVIEEKVDGHPVIVLYGGYTFFCESLDIKHSVEYDACPYSFDGWPNMVIVYEIMEGEVKPPYTAGQGTGKWLTRDEKQEVCEMVGAPLVPEVYRGIVKPEDVPGLADRISSFSRDAKSEGVVLKNLTKGLFGKFINLEFQEGISDDVLQGQVHPMQARKKNIRKYHQ